MREYSAPAANPVTDDENLADVVWANAERFSDVVSFRRQVDGTWLDITAKDFAAQVLAVAKGMAQAGIAPGDRIGLMSKTRYEWPVALGEGCVEIGTLSVPISTHPFRTQWSQGSSTGLCGFRENTCLITRARIQDVFPMSHLSR